MSPAPDPAARDLAVIEAAARALNDELTILANAEDAADFDAARRRCAWHVAAMLDYAHRRGARAGAASLTRLVERGP